MGESISSGVLAKWHVKDGDAVKKDQPIFELETDKITSEGTAESAGKIALKAAAGAEVKIGQVVATIDTESAGTPAKEPQAPAEKKVKEQGVEARQSPAKADDPVPSQPAADKAGGAAQSQSPAVRRIAEETGVDPSTVAGTGKAGRVTKGDMLASSVKPPSSAPPSGATAGAAPSAADRQTRKKISPLRQRIAQRLVAAQHEAAMLTTFNETDMSAVMALRAKFQEDFVKKNGVKLGFTSFFAKAVVHALKAVPAINAQIDGDHFVENHYYDIGIAVSTERGLMVPVIRDCDRLSLAEIEKSVAEAAQRARDGKITLADLEGGVFTITNGGIFGSMLSTPIINPPQSAILGLHAITERPMAVNGQVVIRPMMYLALSYDHRIVDGREAVTFLLKVKQAIEEPMRLMLGV